MGTKTDKKSKQDKKMGKKPPPPPKPVESSEESDSDDSSEEEVVATKPKAPPAKPGLKRKAEASDNDSDDSDESDGEPPKKSKNRNAVQKPAKPVAKKLPAKPVKQQDSDEDSSSEDNSSSEDEPAPKAVKNGKVTKKQVSDEDSSEESEDDSDAPPPKPKQTKMPFKLAPATVMRKGKPAPVEDDSDDSSDDDTSDDSDEEPPKAKKAAQPTAKKTKPAPAEDSDDDDDSSEDDSEEEPAQKAKPTKKAAPAKQADSSEEEDDEDEDEDEEEDDEEEEEASVGQKRKKAMKESTPAKKAKTEETISLFVGNLDPTLPPQKVEKFFKKNGIDVAEVRKPDNKRFCYVDLANADDLEDALALSGKMLGTEAIKVDKARQRNDAPQGRGQDARQDSRKSFGNDDEGKVLFVKNLAESVTEEQLQELFPKAHTVRMPTNRDTGTHKGYAFIEFEKEADVDAALEEKQGEELEGSSLYLDKASNKPKQNQNRSFDRGQRGGKSPGASRGETNVLIAKNLNYQTDNDSLREAFEGATTARVVTDWDSGRSKGFGFVEFSSPEAAAEAFDSMSGQSIDGRQVTLDFASPGGRGGGGRGGGGRGGRGRGGFGDRGRGGFGDRGRGGRGGGRGRGGFGDRGRGGRGGGPPPAKKGTIQDFQGKKKTFDDSD